MKKLFITMLAILCLSACVQAAALIPNQPFTSIELSDNYEIGFQRLVRTIRKTKGIDCKAIDLKPVSVVDHPEIKSHYKLTIESNVKWVNGHWIIDLVPYTKENMSIKTARAINPKYDWWFVYYNEKGQPEAVAWARYGN